MKQILKDKFKPRIKARIRKNKQIINKNIDNFFDWIKGAELVELKKICSDMFFSHFSYVFFSYKIKNKVKLIIKPKLE